MGTTHRIVTNAIETILDEGAHKLYDAYIKQKLPSHTNQQIYAYVGDVVGVSFMDA